MQNSTWLEVCLIVDGEMAEAIAEVLARYAPGGVMIESTKIIPDPEGEGHPAGPLRVCAYLPIDAQIEDKRQRLREDLWYLGRIKPLPDPQFNVIKQTDWSEAWKKHYRPVMVGDRLQIVPAWLEPPDADRIPIKIDPGLAFGTGTHPTTQMCLESIQDVFKDVDSQHAIDKVIDVGCGSAILAIAALKLGVGRALGVDTDPQALDSARQNAKLNSVSSRLELGQGSIAEILAGLHSIQQAPLVLANILAPVIIRLLHEGLAQLLSPHGVLVLSGILEEQAGEVTSALEHNDLRLISTHQIEDWITLRASYK